MVFNSLVHFTASLVLFTASQEGGGPWATNIQGMAVTAHAHAVSAKLAAVTASVRLLDSARHYCRARSEVWSCLHWKLL